MKPMQKKQAIRPVWLLIACFLGSFLPAQAQGFYKEYPLLFNGLMTPERIVTTPGGGYILPVSDKSNGRIAWVETDANGTQIALRQTIVPPANRGADYVVTNDGNYVSVDSSFNPATPFKHDLQLRWYDFNHNLLQTRTYAIDPLYGSNREAKIISDQDGHLHVGGDFITAQGSHRFFIIEFDALGNTIGQTSFLPSTFSFYTQVLGLQLTPDGNYLLNYLLSQTGATYWITRTNAQTGANLHLNTGPDVVAGGDANGNTMYYALSQLKFTSFDQSSTWTQNLGSLRPYFIMAVDGGWLLVLNQNFVNVVLRKIDYSGNIIWQRTPSVWQNFINLNSAGRQLSDGSILLGGNNTETPFLMKLNPDGVIYPHQITGNIRNDINQNCLADAGDTPLNNWVVQAMRRSDSLFLYALSNTAGYYEMNDVDTGEFVVQVFPPSALWTLCGTPDTVLFATYAPPQTHNADFLAQAEFVCPYLWTYLSTGALRPCRPAVYNLQYGNWGTQDAVNAYVEVRFPPEFTIDSASAPYTLVPPDLIRFDVGTLGVNVQSGINIYTTLECDPDLTGQTLCVGAHASPDSSCIPANSNWLGATVTVDGRCDADSVRFEIKNTGFGPTSGGLGYVIVEDHVISLMGAFDLPAGTSKVVALPKDGTTWRIRADQEPYHPHNVQAVSVAVEGCVSNGATFSTGMVNMFPNYSGFIAEYEDCKLVVNSYDPNVKENYPTGVDAPHYIEQNTALDYQLNFQNTGTAEANTVVLRDSLSKWLDPASIRPGAASHPYTWRLSGPGILEVRFANINLPDSNSNEPASHGFVRFNIKQRRDNPIGSLIENRVGIYFDENPAIMTNTVFNTVGRDFLEVVLVNSPQLPRLQVKVMPNPVNETARIVFENAELATRTFLLYDVAGRVLRTQQFNDSTLEFQRNHLPAGVYWFAVQEESGKLVCNGKMILQ